jgi:serine/threonine-protein kinase HipA
MQAARYAQIPTAEVRLSRNRRILVVTRFDRTPDGNYLGCEDFCVLSGMHAHGRYEGSYELIAKRIGEFVSPEHQSQAFEQLFATLALSCAVENGDAHLKNFAVLYQDPESPVRFAPAYDLISTTVYQQRDIMALLLDGSKAFRDRKRLTAFAQRACGMTSSRIAGVLQRIEHGIDKTRTQIRRYMKQHEDFTRAGKALLAVMERGTKRSILSDS